MKNKKYILLLLLLIPFTSFANKEVNILVSNNIIDITSPDNKYKTLFSGYNNYRFDLFKINFPDFIKINKHESLIQIISNDNDFKLDRKPEMLNFLIEKIGIQKIRKYIDNGILHIIGDSNKTLSHYHTYSSKYYLSKNNELFKGKHLNITHRFQVYNKTETNIKVTLNPFNKELFSGYRLAAEGPYPSLSIFDNSLLPQDLKLVINNNIYYPKITYSLQGYKINQPYPLINNKEIKTKLSYVLIPSYEFDINIPKGINIIGISYLKYIDNGDIIIKESY